MATERIQIVGGGGIKIETAEVGQTVKVKAVDENGKPTEWESTDFPESGTTVITANSVEEAPDDVPDGTIMIVPSEVFGVVDLTSLVSVEQALVAGVQNQKVTVDYPDGSWLMSQLGERPVRVRISVMGTQTLEVDVHAQAIYVNNSLALYQYNAFAYDNNYGLIYLFVQFQESKIVYMARNIQFGDLPL